MSATDHLTIITADSHAGGSHEQYREYLDPQYVDDFDAWRGKYKNPFKDLKDDRRTRNWDSELRWKEQNSDGVVAEVIFPNTVPPFFPSFVLFAQPPNEDDYAHRRAGVQAHNRWLADFVAEAPERRAGIGQIFTNVVEDAIEDARWIKEHDLRGGVLLPNIAPDVKWVKPLYDPCYDPLWATLRGARAAAQRSRRYRPAQLRPLRGVAVALHLRGRRSTPSGRSCSCSSRACSSASPASSS